MVLNTYYHVHLEDDELNTSLFKIGLPNRFAKKTLEERFCVDG
jgi:hypothetical protein